MQEPVGRLTAVDAEATETLKVIAYFDALVNGHATTEVLLRGAAVLSGCAAGQTVGGKTMRVDATGARAAATPGDWPSRSFGDDGIVWIERSGTAHANDEMILGDALSDALATPRVVVDDAALQHRPIGSSRWPTASRPSSPRRQNVVRSGVANVGWCKSRSSGGWAV